MRREVTTNISLDGVMQAPMGSEEDTSGDFRYGGWTAPHADATSGKAVQKEMNQTVDYLFGRKTFEIFASFWPAHSTCGRVSMIAQNIFYPKQ